VPGFRRFESDRVLEGGSIDGNGRSCVLTTESCLLNRNRLPAGGDRPPASREEIEQHLARTLGCERVLWLADGIAGDDTDGHVDGVARFFDSNCILAAVEPDPGDVNYAPLRENTRRLHEMCDFEGKPFEIVDLPMSPLIRADGGSGSSRLPASYANFYLANGVALVPVFDVPCDERAMKIIAECLPGREVVGIRSRDLVVGLGAVHCLTQQEPEICDQYAPTR
jgi:agmatine deiminase